MKKFKEEWMPFLTVMLLAVALSLILVSNFGTIN